MQLNNSRGDAPGLMTEQTNPIAEQKEAGPTGPEPVTIASTGKRQAFQDLKRQLKEGELKNTGTQKLLLEMLSDAEAERDEYKGYVELYRTADREAAVLRERIGGNNLNEMMFTVGGVVGGAMIGLAPFFWDKENPYRGIICLCVGCALVAIFSVLRALQVFRK
jgi:hypothetical protein